MTAERAAALAAYKESQAGSVGFNPWRAFLAGWDAARAHDGDDTPQ